MDWLADILKNLAVSRTLVVATFLTSAVMYWGPIASPDHVPKTPAEYTAYLFAVMILTGTLLILWVLNWLWALSRHGVCATARVLAGSRLSDAESAILFALAKDPTQPLNLDNIDYSRASATKLELHQLTKQLERKGLVRINDWDDNLVSLTELGRERALSIQQQAKRGGSA